MSTGLLWLQCAGKNRLNSAIVFSDRGASRPPPPINASVASTPGPPALVTIVSRSPEGRGCLASISAMLNKSAMLSTRSTPTLLNPALRTSSLPVSAPVWEAAALAAASVLPGLMTMMGLVNATSRAAERNQRASPIVSIYITILSVLGSLPR